MFSIDTSLHIWTLFLDHKSKENHHCYNKSIIILLRSIRDCISTTQLIIIRGNPSKTSGRKGGCVCANVDDLRRGGGRPSTGRPETIFFCVSRVWHIFPSLRASGSQYILRFGRFYAWCGPDVCGRREGCVFQTDEVGQVGVSKKSVFARMSLMDDPLCDNNNF